VGKSTISLRCNCSQLYYRQIYF